MSTIRRIYRPWLPTLYETADVAAIQALQRGTATPEQQKRALAWIIDKAAATYDEAFFNQTAEGQRDTDYALGKAAVGRSIVKMLKLNLAKLRSKEVAKETF